MGVSVFKPSSSLIALGNDKILLSLSSVLLKRDPGPPDLKNPFISCALTSNLFFISSSVLVPLSSSG